MKFNSSMSEEDFYKWLESRSVSEKDRKTLSGKIHKYYYLYSTQSVELFYILQRMVLLLWISFSLIQKILMTLDSLNLASLVF